MAKLNLTYIMRMTTLFSFSSGLSMLMQCATVYTLARKRKL